MVVGLAVSFALGWLLIDRKLFFWLELEPEYTQMLLYTSGLFLIVGVAITDRFGYAKVCRILIAIVPVIVILLYGIAVELHWVNPQKSYPQILSLESVG